MTRRHGPVTGVFHLAGVLGSGMVAFSSAEQAAATLAGKVLGAVALAEVFADRPPLELFVAFSSRAALEGVAGGADYAARQRRTGRAGPLRRCRAADRVLSIDWPRWRGDGLAGPDDPARGLPVEQGVAAAAAAAGGPDRPAGRGAALPGRPAEQRTGADPAGPGRPSEELAEDRPRPATNRPAPSTGCGRSGVGCSGRSTSRPMPTSSTWAATRSARWS